MSSKGDSLADRVQASYLQLSAVASDLNSISDELGNSVAEIDAALKRLNLGIEVWVQITFSRDDEFGYYCDEIGYAKVDGRWGIALKSASGNEQDPEGERSEQWLFNDGPRKLRLSSIEKLPELLRKLSEEAVDTANQIKSKLADAKAVAAAVKSAAEPKEPERRIRRIPEKPVGNVEPTK
jgi:hypothetical protein